MLMMWPDRCWRITGRPHDEGGAPEIGRELTLKSGGGQFLEIAEEAEARIVDQDIDAAKLLQCLLDSYLGLGFVGDVELDEGEVLAAATAKSLADFVKIPASGDHTVAGPESRFGNSRANTTTCACNEPCFTRNSQAAGYAARAFMI